MRRRVAALKEVGAGPEHIVCTRIYLTDVDCIDEVGRAHGEVSVDARPVTCALVVKGLPAAAFDRFWRPVAEEQLRRREEDAPPTHHLLRLAHVSRRSSSLLGPLGGLLVDG
jgi:enamine deaminase RidA (YjgF/YER057c/UK114 family)